MISLLLTPPPPPRSRGGRPRVEPHRTVTTYVPTGQYDALARLALRHGVSVSGLVRRAIRNAVATVPKAVR